VDCIYEPANGGSQQFPQQLYIHPDDCIDCGACEPECPWGAIFEEAATPGALREDIPLNAAVLEHAGEFRVAQGREVAAPTQADVAANRLKWGLPA
jgi:ferredoxin